ncbi:MAG: TPM domain-containing protein [Sphingosinicella sp.]
MVVLVPALRAWLLALALLVAAPAWAQTFPPLTGRVVDQADLLSPPQEAGLTARLEALEQASSRQLVVATIASLEGYPIEDYGYQLGRHWGIGQRGANNGVILIVAPAERKTRIEVGYGLEPIVTDALSSQIINNDMVPRFRDGDFPGGINAGVEAIIAQLRAPPELAEQRALEAANANRVRAGDFANFIPLAFWVIVVFFILFSMLRRRLFGRKYRRRRGRVAPIVIWGPGMEDWSGRSRGWGGWGGGSFGGGGGGFGGFSGGGGSFGGGGASGGW